MINFLREKSDKFNAFRNLCVKLQNEKNSNIGKIVRIKSDHGKNLKTLFMLIFVINMELFMSF